VRRGSSERIVPTPTRIASWTVTEPSASSRASGDVIHFDSPEAVAILPSSVIAALSVTKGLPVATNFTNFSLSRNACLAEHSLGDADTAPVSRSKPRPFTLGSGSFMQANHLRDPGVNQTVGARRCPAVMHARLQGDVERGSPCVLAGQAERLDLGVRVSGSAMISLPQDAVVLHHQSSDHRIGTRFPLSQSREIETGRQEATMAIEVCGNHDPGSRTGIIRPGRSSKIPST
jgi:hypothetical protein